MKPSSQTRMRAVGFSLVELLVVVLVIAILAALILAAVNRAKASG